MDSVTDTGVDRGAEAHELESRQPSSSHECEPANFWQQELQRQACSLTSFPDALAVIPIV